MAGCASCLKLNIPDGEVCFTSVEEFGKLLCEDTTFPEGDPKREYDRQLNKNDVVTNSDQYFKIRADYIETKRKYLICKKYPKKCQ